jgi:nucleoside-diphosphate-sugar epimerase
LDNSSTGRIVNLEAVSNRVTAHERDIRELDSLQPALAGVDYVIHLAALPSVARSIADPLTANAVNLTGTLNVLLAARDAGVKQVARTVPPCGIRVFSAAIIATVLYSIVRQPTDGLIPPCGTA